MSLFPDADVPDSYRELFRLLCPDKIICELGTPARTVEDLVGKAAKPIDENSLLLQKHGTLDDWIYRQAVFFQRLSKTPEMLARFGSKLFTNRVEELFQLCYKARVTFHWSEKMIGFGPSRLAADDAIEKVRTALDRVHPYGFFLRESFYAMLTGAQLCPHETVDPHHSWLMQLRAPRAYAYAIKDGLLLDVRERSWNPFKKQKHLPWDGPDIEGFEDYWHAKNETDTFGTYPYMCGFVILRKKTK